MTFAAPIPILLMFDATVVARFYVDALGFCVDWEQRFDADLPLYMQLSLGQCVLRLSEHHGDCSPGTAVRIAMPALDALHADLMSREAFRLRPAIERMPWELREMAVLDPFGNRLVFFEPA